jgi:hypothetical protein
MFQKYRNKNRNPVFKPTCKSVSTLKGPKSETTIWSSDQTPLKAPASLRSRKLELPQPNNGQELRVVSPQANTQRWSQHLQQALQGTFKNQP